MEIWTIFKPWNKMGVRQYSTTGSCWNRSGSWKNLHLVSLVQIYPKARTQCTATLQSFSMWKDLSYFSKVDEMTAA